MDYLNQKEVNKKAPKIFGREKYWNEVKKQRDAIADPLIRKRKSKDGVYSKKDVLKGYNDALKKGQLGGTGWGK